MGDNTMGINSRELVDNGDYVDVTACIECATAVKNADEPEDAGILDPCNFDTGDEFLDAVAAWESAAELIPAWSVPMLTELGGYWNCFVCDGTQIGDGYTLQAVNN